MDNLQIAFLISTFPGMLMALSNWANPDMETWHRTLTGVFCILWLGALVNYIHNFRGAT